jgi:hypothetical protein
MDLVMLMFNHLQLIISTYYGNEYKFRCLCGPVDIDKVCVMRGEMKSCKLCCSSMANLTRTIITMV